MSENKMIGEKELEKIISELRLIGAVICLSTSILILMLSMGLPLIKTNPFLSFGGLIISGLLMWWALQFFLASLN